MSVRERFTTLMEERNFSQSKFCKITGYRQSSITKFVTGRTQYPKQDFFEAVKKAFPDINLNWLIMGEGPRKFLPKGLPDLSDPPTKVNIEELTAYKGHSLSNPGDTDLTREEWHKGMALVNRLLIKYIKKDLLPKLKEIDPEMADEVEEDLLGM